MNNKHLRLARPRGGTGRILRSLLLAGLVASTGAVAGGCALFGVQPWERELLSEPSMRIGGEGVDVTIDDHIYFSKEASSGGRGIGGGGCGCN